jgi:hypothetical protein
MKILDYVTNLDSHLYYQNEIIVNNHIGDIENTLYFIVKGKVEVTRIMEPNIPLKTLYLKEGDFFGFYKNPPNYKILAEYKSLEANTKIGKLDTKTIIHIGKSNPLFFFTLLKNSIEKMLVIEKEISSISESIILLREGIQ